MADSQETEEELILRVFLTEALEHLSSIESDLLAIEAAGEQVTDDQINRVFRAAHNLKGGAATLNLPRIRELAHKVENVLSLLRTHEIPVNAETINLLLRSFDRLRGLVELGAASEKEDVSDFVAALTALTAGKGQASPKSAGSAGSASASIPIFVSNGPTEPPVGVPVPVVTGTTESASPGAAAVSAAPASQAVATHAAGGAPALAPAGGDATLRVSVNILESLMNLAGELVLGRNQLMDAISRSDGRAISASGQKVSMVTSELQETIMLTRMQPIGNVLNKFPRLVRDLSQELGKDVHLDIVGKDVAVDKTIIEALSDPLTHMVRNAIDHGIETPEKRRAAGKDPAGRVSIKAYHEAGQIIIEIVDDGRGMDGQKIAASAVSKGLLRSEQVKTMSEKDLLGLIFLPGLSTAEKISDVSGRGVGMDVVKSNLEKLGGKIEIDTSIGKGSRFRIKLPLTLAIIPSLLVSVNEERFAIPQINIDELIRIPAEQVKKRIEVVGDVNVLVLRGELIPLVRLADLLGIEREYEDPNEHLRRPDRRVRIADRRSPHCTSESTQDGPKSGDVPSPSDRREGNGRRYHANSDINVVIVSTGTLQYGLIVEKLHESVEIVVKPLGRHLKGLREYAGSTIMGDGQVALILDVAGISSVAGLSSVSGSDRARELEEQQKAASFKDLHSFLLMRNNPTEQMAIPLELVWRIEHVQPAQVEKIGGRRTMQYRGASLPLLTLQDVLPSGDMSPAQEWIVAVFDVGGREVGLLGARPVDIVETDVVIDTQTLRQTGVIGSAIIREQTTLVLDIFEIVKARFPEWQLSRSELSARRTGVPVVVLAEDSAFFREQLTQVLSGAGLKVLSAEDGAAAWEMLDQHGDEVRLLVTDIEMPRMNGLELSRKVRGDARFKELPIIAVTSLAGEEDALRGRESGISDYQIKMDKARLVDSINRYLGAEVSGKVETA